MNTTTTKCMYGKGRLSSHFFILGLVSLVGERRRMLSGGEDPGENVLKLHAFHCGVLLLRTF